MAVLFPDRSKYEIDYSDEFVDLIKGLLQKDPKKRLGAENSAQELLSHPFFSKYDLDGIIDKKIQAPFLPASS